MAQLRSETAAVLIEPAMVNGVPLVKLEFVAGDARFPFFVGTQDALSIATDLLKAVTAVNAMAPGAGGKAGKGKPS